VIHICNKRNVSKEKGPYAKGMTCGTHFEKERESKERSGKEGDEMQKSRLREAFTMIELIFVIVIIGVLVGVAIPKLAATRTDALISVKAQNIMTGTNEIAAYAMSNGKTLPSITAMSAGFRSLVQAGEATDTGNYKIEIKEGNMDDCIIFEILYPGSNTETLSIDYGNGSVDFKCSLLRKLIDPKEFPMKLHGTTVIY